MKLLPRELTLGLKRFSKKFLLGVWNGMGPGPKKASKGPRRPKRR